MRLPRKAGVRARHHAAGQVLPAAVFLLLACVAFLYWTVNSGQMVTEKMKLTNAADAAAYSAGVVHARALNLDAYTNRAIVANQVAIAQTLSLVSWGNYFVDVYCNAGTLGHAVMETAITPDDLERWTKLGAVAVGSAFSQMASIGNGCESAAEINDAWNVGAGVAITAFNGASAILAASQQLLHIAPMEATLYARAQQAAQRTVDAFGSHIDATIVPLTYDPAGMGNGGTFAMSHGGNDRARLRDVVLASRDAYTAGRDWTIHKVPSVLEHRIERRGSTTMSDLDTWAAEDSLVHRWRQWRHNGWRDRATVIGHGTADSGDDASSRSQWLRRDYDLTAWYSGLPSVHGLRDRSNDPARTRYGITVHVEKRRADTLTSQHAAQAGPAGRLAVFGAAPSPSTMSALARAQVTFDRPPRADGRTEYANLYNPYWQVRLVDPTAQDRAYAASRQGNVMLPAP